MNLNLPCELYTICVNVHSGKSCSPRKISRGKCSMWIVCFFCPQKKERVSPSPPQPRASSHDSHDSHERRIRRRGRDSVVQETRPQDGQTHVGLTRRERDRTRSRGRRDERSRTIQPFCSGENEREERGEGHPSQQHAGTDAVQEGPVRPRQPLDGRVEDDHAREDAQPRETHHHRARDVPPVKVRRGPQRGEEEARRVQERGHVVRRRRGRRDHDNPLCDAEGEQHKPDAEGCVLRLEDRSWIIVFDPQPRPCGGRAHDHREDEDDARRHMVFLERGRRKNYSGWKRGSSSSDPCCRPWRTSTHADPAKSDAMIARRTDGARRGDVVVALRRGSGSSFKDDKR